MFILSLIWSGLALTILLLIKRQFRLIEHIRLNEPIETIPPLSVVIPVRNEEINIEKCLSHVLAQDYPHLEVIVVNDGSTDNTVEITSRIADVDKRVRLIEAGQLPSGWKGKTNACWQGALIAKGDWLCFIDADTWPSMPALFRSSVATCENRGLAMISCQPFQELGSAGERLIYPTGFILLLLLLDFKRINDPQKPDAAATGQFILIRREVYDASGGHQNDTVRNAFLEDMALAQLIKRKGFRLALMLGDQALQTRMYTSLLEMWTGFARMVFDLFQGAVGSSVAAIGAILMGWLPVFIIGWQVSHSTADLFTISALIPGLVAMLALHIWLSLYFRIPILYGVTYPLGYALGAGILVSGIVQRMILGVSWRGRTYA